MKRALSALLIIGLIGAGAGAYYIKNKGTEITVNTSPVTRGDVTDTVGATGTLQAVTTVQVGSQVSGNIAWLGADFNSIVHKGQVIARLDPSLFDAQLQQARANLIKSQADVDRSKVQLTDAQTKYNRAKELAARSLVPQSELDAAKATVDAADATVQSSQAQVTQAQATVNQNNVNLEHTIITAPIDGIIIQRSVDVGQTVAASLQSPTLFIIAADLTKMQVNANIDEADVGRIRPGQAVTFRVDAYPTEEFQGTVAQIRLQPVVVQNVTTYGTIVDVPNKDLKLKPGMTANLKVQIARRSDVMRVPNAALRFRPTSEIFAALNQPVPPEAAFAGGRGGGRGQGAGGAQGGSGTKGGSWPQGAGDAGGRGFGAKQGAPAVPAQDGQSLGTAGEGGRGGRDGKPGSHGAPAAGLKSSLMMPKYGAPQSAETIDALFAPLQPVESRGRAWLYMGKELKPVNLRLGITDGTNTELLSGELQPGLELVTSAIMGSGRPAATSGTGNPLLPQRGPGPGGFGGPGRGR